MVVNLYLIGFVSWREVEDLTLKRERFAAVVREMQVDVEERVPWIGTCNLSLALSRIKEEQKRAAAYVLSVCNPFPEKILSGKGSGLCPTILSASG
jgi:hypothetical protein